MQVGYNFTQHNGYIPATWILLDTCPTESMTCHKELVSNIKVCKPADKLTIYTNGGSQQYEQVADMSILPMKVHFNAL